MFDVDWDSLFVPSGSLVDILLRGTLMYLGLFLVLRFLLRRQTGGLGISDVLVVVVIADAAQNGMAGEYKSITEGFLLVLTIVFWDFVIDWVGHRFEPLKRLARPEALLLVRDGALVEDNLEREKITHEELRAQLRLQGVDDVADVSKAYIEGDGRVSVIRRKPEDEQRKLDRPGQLP